MKVVPVPLTIAFGALRVARSETKPNSPGLSPLRATVFGLWILLAGLLAGCGASSMPRDLMEDLLQAEAALETEGVALLDEALSSFGDVPPASARQIQSRAPSPRPLTIIRDSDGSVVVGWATSERLALEELVNRPLFVVAREERDRGVSAYLGVLRRGAGGYEVEWYGKRENGRRLTRLSPLAIAGPVLANPCVERPAVTWKKLGSTMSSTAVRRILTRLASLKVPSPPTFPGTPLGRDSALPPSTACSTPFSTA